MNHNDVFVDYVCKEIAKFQSQGKWKVQFVIPVMCSEQHIKDVLLRKGYDAKVIMWAATVTPGLKPIEYAIVIDNIHSEIIQDYLAYIGMDDVMKELHSMLLCIETDSANRHLKSQAFYRLEIVEKHLSDRLKGV